MGPIYHHFRYISFSQPCRAFSHCIPPIQNWIQERVRDVSGHQERPKSLTNGSYEPYDHNIQANSAKEAIMRARTREISRISICLIAGAVGLLCLVYASNVAIERVSFSECLQGGARPWSGCLSIMKLPRHHPVVERSLIWPRYRFLFLVAIFGVQILMPLAG